MSVVNKMLQDLEARKSQPEEINADYQPPQKKPAKWVYIGLLILAVLAISLALLDINHLFGSKDIISSDATSKVPTQKVAKKLMVAPPQITEQQVPVNQPKVLSTVSAPTKIQTEDVEIATTPLVDNAIAPEPEPEPEPEPTIIPVAEQNPIISEPLVTMSPAVAPEKLTSFSMSGSTKENQASSLKQRIAESLNSNDLDLAQSLLSELLLDEPDNLKARKKLASLYFAQGNYAQTKLLLIRGIDLHPKQTDLKLMLARLYSVQDNAEQALQVMIDVAPNATNQTEFLAYRAALAQQLKQPEVSKADYFALSAIEPTNAKWWLGLAIARDQLGETQYAMQAYKEAYALGQLDDSVDEFIQQRISVLAGSQ